MYTILAVLCVVAAATAGPIPGNVLDKYKTDDMKLPGTIEKDIIAQPGKQYELFKRFTDEVTIPDDVPKHTHTGLNINRGDAVVNEADLNLFYWLDEPHVKFAVKRFMKWDLDSSTDISAEEIKTSLDAHKPHLAVALSECQYLKSDGLEESCYADELLTYIALALGQEDVEKFFKHVDQGGNSITQEDLNAIAKEEGTEKEFKKDITFEELGGHSGSAGVDADEFRFYVNQESLLDDFRRCRKETPDVSTGAVDFIESCLAEELVEYTNDDVTDMDIAVLFKTIDKDDNGFITSAEISHIFPGTKIRVVKAIMEILDMSSTVSRDVDYTEFRTYIRSPTVLEQLENKCTEPLEEQVHELRCMFDLVKELINDEHDPILLEVPDVDQLIAFEILDKSDDGKIVSDELGGFSTVHGGYGNANTLERFFDEMDTDNTNYICLEEFNEYMDIPHMVYATADCLLKGRSTPDDRKNCFVNEIGDTIDNIKYMQHDAFLAWFKHLDGDNNGHITEHTSDKLQEKIGHDADNTFVDLFLEEVGQGGNEINFFEFLWYVKQQELADRYENDGGITDKLDTLNGDKIETLNGLLKKYIEDDVTEYDTDEFFDMLDADDDHDITQADFTSDIKERMKALLEQIDRQSKEEDQDDVVNYREFWLWVNSPNKKDSTKTNKDIFERECSQKLTNQFAELDCYVRLFKKDGIW